MEDTLPKTIGIQTRFSSFNEDENEFIMNESGKWKRKESGRSDEPLTKKPRTVLAPSSKTISSSSSSSSSSSTKISEDIRTNVFNKIKNTIEHQVSGLIPRVQWEVFKVCFINDTPTASNVYPSIRWYDELIHDDVTFPEEIQFIKKVKKYFFYCKLKGKKKEVVAIGSFVQAQNDAWTKYLH